MKKKISYHGFVAGFIVLFAIGLGHSLMMLMEDVLLLQKFVGAIIVGLLGLILLVIGVRKNHKKVLASMMGLLAGMLIWTGWVEFSFVWIAEKLQIPDIVKGEEIITKSEYLLMPSTIGLLAIILLFYIFTKSRCPFFRWIQNVLLLKFIREVESQKPIAVIAFMGSVVTMWFGYLLLMIIYDPDIVGDRHPIVWFVGIGSLVWSGYHFNKLIRLPEMGYAIRYSIPTIVIFWNVIEILGRWGVFKEIWSAPQEHSLEMIIILIIFIVLTGYVFFFKGKTKHTHD